MKYQRCIFSSEHSHQLQKGDFLPHYNLLKFLENDLEFFGSNSIPNLIEYAKKKNQISLNYHQAYYLLKLLEPKHDIGDTADFIKSDGKQLSCTL